MTMRLAASAACHSRFTRIFNLIRRRLRLDRLECRLAPAIATWDGGGPVVFQFELHGNNRTRTRDTLAFDSAFLGGVFVG